MDGIWSRRTNNPSKLSLSSTGNGSTAQPSESSPSGRTNASFAKRFGGDSSSHDKRSNPFNSVTTPGAGGLVSPGASAFALGTGAFASFGSAKTPKAGGNPFEASYGAAATTPTAKTPSAEKSIREGGLFARGSSTVGKAAEAKTGGALTKGTSSRGGDPTAHSLKDNWVFWFRPPISKANGYIEYEKTIFPMAKCGTAEEFFAVYKHLNRPSTLPLVSDYHMFKEGIRPIWEDDVNKKGGKWVVRLKKGVADRYWEDLLLALIGDQFFDAGEEICGAVLSVRNGEDILSIWTRTESGRVLKIKDHMKRILAFPPETKVDFKSHDASMAQRTAIEESRREKANEKRAAANKQQQQAQQQGTDRKPTAN